MLTDIENIGASALEELQKIDDLDALEKYRVKYLGRKGQITQLLSQIGKFPKDQTPQAGQLINKI